MKCKYDYSHYRWTLDEKKDLHMLKEIFFRLYGKNNKFSMYDVIEILKSNPRMLETNANIPRNAGF